MPALPPARPDLNFTHLRSFRAAAAAGGIAAAARRLGLAQPTVSEQVAALERALGGALLERRGGALLPTALGRRVLAHAEDIFAAAERLIATASGGEAEAPRLVAGVVETVPKRVAWRLLAPALAEGAVIECREGGLESLLGELAVHRLDVVVSDAPLPPGVAVQAYNHLLGDSPVAWFAAPGVVAPGTWPARLDQAPVLLPAAATPLRRRLDDWLEAAGVRPRLVAEFQDTALLKAAGGAGAGAFAAPAVLAGALAEELGVEELGTCAGVSERFYAISPERRISHPAVVAICERARRVLQPTR